MGPVNKWGLAPFIMIYLWGLAPFILVENLRINSYFPYIPFDYLCVLGTKIKDNDLLHVPILAEE
jgi:hypothetical protein